MKLTANLAQFSPGTLLTEAALAESLGVSARTVRRMVERGELPGGVKLGGRKIWFSDKVLAYLQERAERRAEESRAHAARVDEFLL